MNGQMPPELALRRAQPVDAEQIAWLNAAVQQLHAAAHPEIFKPHVVDAELIAWYRDFLEQPDNHVFIAEVADVAVGYVTAKVIRRPETPFTHPMVFIQIDQISVNEDQRGRGYGAALMAVVTQLAREEMIDRIVLQVWDFNVHAIKFYQRIGYTTFIRSMECRLSDGLKAESELCFEC